MKRDDIKAETLPWWMSLMIALPAGLIISWFLNWQVFEVAKWLVWGSSEVPKDITLLALEVTWYIQWPIFLATLLIPGWTIRKQIKAGSGNPLWILLFYSLFPLLILLVLPMFSVYLVFTWWLIAAAAWAEAFCYILQKIHDSL